MTAREHNGMQDVTDDLTPKQVKVLMALLAGRSIEAAANEAGVNPATVHRWQHDPVFSAARQAGRRELAQQGLGLMQNMVRSAVGVIAEIMSDRTKPATVRLRAAQIVIENTIRWLETEDIEQRLAALEEKYAAQALQR